MKIFLFLFSFLSLAAISKAQFTTPRFGTTPNQDNTGRALTYRSLDSIVAHANLVTDTLLIFPRAWDNSYTLDLTTADSVRVEIKNLSQSYEYDNLHFTIKGPSGAYIKFFNGVNTTIKSAGTATLSTNGRARIDFVFDGAFWVEDGRVVQ